jgi:tetratricopeptide (TPR) repeat protein
MTTDPNTSGNHNEDVMHDDLSCYEKGLDLAEAGKYEEALEHVLEHLRRSPDDAEVLNDTGAILHCLGRSDEAIEHFMKARRIRSDSAEILWNLAEAYLAIGRASEAAQVFDEMDRLGVLNADLLNRTAEAFLNQNNKAGALEMLLRSLVIWPEQEILHPMVDVIRFKRPKVAFFCDENATTAVNEIARFVKERFDVRFLEDRSDDQVRELMKWSDISWFESGSDLAVTGSKQQKVCKNIIRLPRDEEDPQWSEAVNWANIDVRLTVGDCDAEETLAQELDKINRVLIKLETEIESEQAEGPSCDDLQGRTFEEVALSAQSAVPALEEN